MFGKALGRKPAETRVELPSFKPISDQPQGPDMLPVLGLRRLVRWKYGRLVFQLPLLLLAVFVIIDGFTGVQYASRNVATTSVWLCYRVLVLIAIAILGNAFCAACPRMLTRGLSRRLERLLPAKLSWPRGLQNKYFVIGLLVLFFFSYEAFNLWESPWLTAWLAVGYFVAALAVDTLFPAGTFCRYVCPLGNFNFALSTVAPTQITAVNHDICRSCEHKPCLHGRETYETRGAFDAITHQGPVRRSAFIPTSEIRNANGEGYFPGCETNLFAPAIQSNMDCTNCFNCIRACPYDNVALTLRAPAREATRSPWLRRGGIAVMVMGALLAFYGLLNAAAMVAPFHVLANNFANLTGITSDFTLLVLLFGATGILGIALPGVVSLAADRLGGNSSSTFKEAFQRWGYVLVVLGFGFWAAHYLYHFLTGALSIAPVFQHFFHIRGLGAAPDWELARLVPGRALFPIPAAVTLLYTLLATVITFRIGLRDFGRNGVLAMWPVLLFIIGFAVLGMWLLGQPMEMRGTILVN